MSTQQEFGIVQVRTAGYGALAEARRVDWTWYVEWFKVQGGFDVYLRRRDDSTDEILSQSGFKNVATWAEVQALAREWDKEIQAKRQAAAPPVEPFAEPPPKVSIQERAGNADRRDMERARSAALRRAWPRTWAAVDAKKDREAIVKAYVLDTAALTGCVSHPTDPTMAREIAAALQSFSRRRRKGDTVLIDRTIAFNWPRLVYLSDREMAAEVNRLLSETGIKVTASQVKARRLRLDLTSRRLPGPPRKS